MNPFIIAGLGLAAIVYGITRRKGTPTMTGGTTQGTKRFDAEVYPPNSAELTELLAVASGEAGTPAQWAADPAMHRLIAKESGGWIGRPNYTYGQRNDQRFPRNISNTSMRHMWPEVHEEIRQGIKGAKSTATGMGQFIISNVDMYYPDGRAGVGDALNEATGMLRYVRDRYGDPARALEFHIANNWY